MQLSLKIAIWTSSQRLEVEYFIKTKNVDILVLQVSETHFTDKSYFKINGSDLIISNYLDGMAHGGSAILIKSSPNRCFKANFSTIYSINLFINFFTNPKSQWCDCHNFFISPTTIQHNQINF